MRNYNIRMKEFIMFKLSVIGDEISSNLQEQVNLLIQENINHIELRSINNKNIVNWTSHELSEVKKLLDDNNITVSGLSSPIGKTPITDPPDLSLANFQKILDYADYFQTNNIRIFGYYLPDTDHISWGNAVVDRLHILLETAKARGHILHLENEDGSLFGSTPDEVRFINKHISSPNFDFLYDPGNYIYFMREAVSHEMTPLMLPLTGYLHVKDIKLGSNQFLVPGKGDCEFEKIITELCKLKQTDVISLEPHLQGGDSKGGFSGIEPTREAIRSLKNILNNIEMKESLLKNA